MGIVIHSPFVTIEQFSNDCRKYTFCSSNLSDNVHILVFLLSIFRFVTRMNDTNEYLFVLLFIRKIPTFVSSR